MWVPLVETATLSAATFLGGTGTHAFFQWLRARRRAPVEDMTAQVGVARDINGMALATLERVSEELVTVTDRLDKVEAAQEESVAELTRVTGLFREALEVLRRVVDGVRAGQLPELHMSDELRAEVERGEV